MAGVRTTAERAIDVRRMLATEEDFWIASADAQGEAYLIPLSFYWDGSVLVFATPRDSRTARNVRRAGKARVGLGPTRDVVIIEGPVEELGLAIDDELAAAHARATGFDARDEPQPYTYLQLSPRLIQAWRTSAELADRVVMRAGRWLA